MTKMQQWLGLLLEDLAGRFNLSISMMSVIFKKMINIMYDHLIKWPSRETTHSVGSYHFFLNVGVARILTKC